MKETLKRMLFVLIARFATTWPTSVLMDMLHPHMNAWYEQWFQKPNADQMMQIVFQSQAMEPSAPCVDIPEGLIDTPHFISQLFTYAHLDNLCVTVQYPVEQYNFYKICLLHKGHSQPHFMLESSDFGGVGY